MTRLHSPDAGAREGWRRLCYDIVFGYDTPAGRAFDVTLIVMIVASVAVALADSLVGCVPVATGLMETA